MSSTVRASKKWISIRFNGMLKETWHVCIVQMLNKNDELQPYFLKPFLLKVADQDKNNLPTGIENKSVKILFHCPSCISKRTHHII